MAIDPDPYRTLGLARGATREEIRVAYRRLAKIHHPDTAGPTALPRFLAIQAAYEQLLRGTASGGRAGRPGPPRRAWDADPERADATRRAYGGRARSARPGGSPTGNGARPGTTGQPSGPTGTTGTTGTAGTTGTTGKAGTTSSTGRAGTTDRAGTRRPGASGSGSGSNAKGDRSSAGGSSSGTRRRNKATLGSTSYDDADSVPFEPDWAGASWYGTTSGTYWTLNPKEYADPRKHGPEYQARAKRATRAWSTRSGAPEDEPPAPGDPNEPSSEPEPEPEPVPHAGPPPGAAPTAGQGTPWWASSTASGAATESAARRPQGGGRRWWSDERRAERQRSGGSGTADGPPPPPPDLARAAADIARAITDDRFGGLRGRVVRALIGWLPIALGIGWAFGEITGCGRFAASCDGTADPIVLLLQVAALALLLIVPPLASLATVAAMALLGAAVVATLILSATGTKGDPDVRREALGAVLLVAWLGGLAVGVLRRVRDLPTRGRPVS